MTRARTWRLAQALLLGLSLGACAPAAVRAAQLPAAETSIAHRLYFGRSIPGGGTVSEADWRSFLHEVVTPRFPAGLTVWRAEGQWRDGSGTLVREESFVLELIHPADARSGPAVREIIAEYRRRFRQESVLHVRDRVEVSF